MSNIEITLVSPVLMNQLVLFLFCITEHELTLEMIFCQQKIMPKSAKEFDVAYTVEFNCLGETS